MYTCMMAISQASSEFRHFRRKPRERISSFARRLLNKPEKPETQLYREPPDAFLDPDYEVCPYSPHPPSLPLIT